MTAFQPDFSPLHRPKVLKILRSVLLGTTAIAGAFAIVTPDFTPAYAQAVPQTNPDAQLLLKSDQLIYDNDKKLVTAVGNVQLDYDGYNVVADRITYNQSTRKVTASGNVEIVEPSGNRIFAQEIDLTDDFGEGFVNALRVETPDNTRFAAESAERFAGGKTVFNHGVYTACEPCKEKPNKPPIWQVKAQTVILDGEAKTVTYRHARFELFGLPIAYFPFFRHADSTVERKTGFLVPTFGHTEELGTWLRQPYFIATGESHDLTVAATHFTRQGQLYDARWRHQLENGFYKIKVAGISQQEPDAFEFEPDNAVIDRGMVSTSGRFDINPKWAFGWELLAQTDSNFSRTYKVSGHTAWNITNRVYLEGLHYRSFLNLSAKQYLIQSNTLTGSGTALQFESEQPFIRPVLDYNRVQTEQFTGGELSLDVNVTSLERDVLSVTTPASGSVRTHGINGETTRASVDLAWRKSYISSGGFSITPSTSLRGDWTSTSGFSATTGPQLSTGDTTRFMPTAGLEVSYPILARLANSSHVFEPKANVFARPDLAFDGVAPNEDAQSLVFDTTRLFARDKFSGYDRIESGTRANVGLTYSGNFDNGLSLNAMVGQSFHIAGENPYARTDDLANVGEQSGLETDVSDIVASFNVSYGAYNGISQQMRFNHESFDLERSATTASYYGDVLSLTANYTFIAAQPDYAFGVDRQQIGFTAGVKFADNWTISTAAQYDLEDSLVVNNSYGLSYHDECFTFTLGIAESRTTSNDDVDRTFSFKIGFRTIGEFENSIGTSEIDSANQDGFLGFTGTNQSN